jgi:MarR family transcriptional regulator, lower aerobic nicotinate degradation pathway regulator
MTPKTPVSDLETHIGYWLRYVSNHVSQAFAKRLLAEDVTVSEWVALRCLYDLDKGTQNDLAQAMGMTKAPVSRILDRLAVKKLVRREESATDARARLIRLTPEGRALVPKLAHLADINDSAFFRCLSQKEQAAIVHIMRKLVAHHGLTRVPTE